MKILAGLLALSVVLTISMTIIDNPFQPIINGTAVNVLPANVIWAKTYGVLGDNDRAYYALSTDYGYLVVGSSESNSTGVTIGIALMLDAIGNEIWNQTFLYGSGTELRFAVNYTNGFLLIGNEFLSSGGVNGYVARIDYRGDLIWQTAIAGNETQKFYSAFASSDGFVLLGLSSPNGGVSSKALVVKINADGNVIWEKTYSFASDTVVRTGVLAPDGNYVVSGFTDTRGTSNYDFLLMKINPSGDLVWSRTYGDNGTQEAYSMVEAANGFIMVGDTQSIGANIHALVVKVDWNGSMIWTKTVGGKNADSPSYIACSRDGGYLVSGFTFSFGAGNRDFWLFKIDDLGHVIWSCTQGNAGYQEAYSVVETGKNQYLMAGWTDPLDRPDLIGKARYMFYIVSLNYPVDNGLLSLTFVYYILIGIDVLLFILFVSFYYTQKMNRPARDQKVTVKDISDNILMDFFHPGKGAN